MIMTSPPHLADASMCQLLLPLVASQSILLKWCESSWLLAWVLQASMVMYEQWVTWSFLWYRGQNNQHLTCNSWCEDVDSCSGGGQNSCNSSSGSEPDRQKKYGLHCGLCSEGRCGWWWVWEWVEWGLSLCVTTFLQDVPIMWPWDVLPQLTRAWECGNGGCDCSSAMLQQQWSPLGSVCWGEVGSC